MSACDDKQDEYLKNEYILNLNELIMTRNYVYKEKTYQKYRLTDLSVKKSNSSHFFLQKIFLLKVKLSNLNLKVLSKYLYQRSRYQELKPQK